LTNTSDLFPFSQLWSMAPKRPRGVRNNIQNGAQIFTCPSTQRRGTPGRSERDPVSMPTSTHVVETRMSLTLCSHAAVEAKMREGGQASTSAFTSSAQSAQS